MSYRKIQPSHTVESAASTSNPSLLRQSTNESAGSDPVRQNVSPEKEFSAPSSTSKRRRVPESVTRNACLNCKKARAKCDGKKPCTRCQTRVDSSNCVYEIHIKHAKEELVKQIKELKARNCLNDQIFQALSCNEQVPEIVSRIQRGDSNESIVDYLGRTQIVVEADDIVSPRGSQKSMFESSDQEMSSINASLGGRGQHYWSTVTDDIAIFHHLFQLYFAWTHPVNTLFNEGHFVESYNAQSDVHCSPALVNAICAMACHLHTATDVDEVNFEQLGRRFSDAARITLDLTHPNITTAQALAVLSLVDLARGRSIRAASYLRAANQVAFGIAQRIGDKPSDVVLYTLRGLRNLTVEWGLITSQAMPYTESVILDPQDEIEYGLDRAHWYHYRDMHGPCTSWPCLLATTNREKSKLINIVAEMNDMHYNPLPQTIQARAVLSLYVRLMEWRTNLARVLDDVEDRQAPALPHVLSLLILHSAAVVHLLRPLIDLPQDRAIPTPHTKEIVWRYAQEGLSLLNNHYRRRYTTRYQPVFQSFSILHFCDVIIRFFPNVKTAGTEASQKSGDEALHIVFNALMTTRRGFPIAGPLQELLRRTAVGCSIRMPHDIEMLTAAPRPPYDAYSLNDFVEACAGISYVQRTLEIQSRYSASFAQDWITEANRRGLSELSPLGEGILPEEERGAQSLMQIRNLLNVT